MRLEWSQEFSVGVEEIDDQHKELFIMINNLDLAMKQGRAKEEVVRLVGFLENYGVIHFGTEEKYMVSYNDPDYQLHKKKHEWFVKELSAIKEKLEADGPTADVIVRSNSLLIEWFSNHIRTVDKGLGIFLKLKKRS